jgi:hypothetical protein
MEKEQWIVACNEPFYPWVVYFDTEEEAEKAFKEAVDEESCYDECTVTLAKVIKSVIKEEED